MEVLSTAVRHSWWPYALNAIRKYPEYERQHNLQMDTLGAAQMDGMPHGTSPGRSVEAAALSSRMDSQEIKEYNAVKLALEWAILQSYGQQKVKLINLLYFEKKWKKISDAAEEVHLSDRTAFRFHREFVTMVGVHLI